MTSFCRRNTGKLSRRSSSSSPKENEFHICSEDLAETTKELRRTTVSDRATPSRRLVSSSFPILLFFTRFSLPHHRTTLEQVGGRHCLKSSIEFWTRLRPRRHKGLLAGINAREMELLSRARACVLQVLFATRARTLIRDQARRMLLEIYFELREVCVCVAELSFILKLLSIIVDKSRLDGKETRIARHAGNVCAQRKLRSMSASYFSMRALSVK